MAPGLFVLLMHVWGKLSLSKFFSTFNFIIQMKAATIFKAFITVIILSILIVGKRLIDQEELLYNVLGIVIYLIGAFIGIILSGSRSHLS